MGTRLLVAAALCLPSTAAAQIDQELVEGFGRGVLTAIRDGSLEALAPRIASAEDFVEIVSRMPGLSTEQRAGALATKDEFETALREHFAEALARAASSGIDYRQVEFVGVRAETRVPEEDPKLDPAVLADLRSRSADVSIVVAYEGKERRIHLRDCFRVDRGWVLMERATFGLVQ